MADIEEKSGPKTGIPDKMSIEGEVAEVQTHEETNLKSVAEKDIGFDLFPKSLQYDTAQLEIDAVKVRRKLDFIVLPMMVGSSHSLYRPVLKFSR